MRKLIPLIAPEPVARTFRVRVEGELTVTIID